MTAATIPAYLSTVEPVAIAYDAARDCRIPDAGAARPALNCAPKALTLAHGGPEPKGLSFGFLRTDCALLHGGIEATYADAAGTHPALENGIVSVRFDKTAPLSIDISADPNAALALGTCRLDVLSRASVRDGAEVTSMVDALVQGMDPAAVKAGLEGLDKMAAPLRTALDAARAGGAPDAALAEAKAWLAAFDKDYALLKSAAFETPAFDDVFTVGDGAVSCGTDGTLTPPTIDFTQRLTVSGAHFALGICRLETQLKDAYGNFDVQAVTARSDAAGATYRAFGRSSPAGGKFFAFALDGRKYPAQETLTLTIVLAEIGKPGHLVTVSKALARLPLSELTKAFGPLRLVGTSRGVIAGDLPSHALRTGPNGVVWVNDRSHSSDPRALGEFLMFEMDYDVPADVRFYGERSHDVEVFGVAVGDNYKHCFLLSHGYGANLAGEFQAPNFSGKGTIRFYGAPSFFVHRGDQGDCQGRIDALAGAGHGLPVHVTTSLDWIDAELGAPVQSLDLEMQKFDPTQLAETAGMFARTADGSLDTLVLTNSLPIDLIGFPKLQVTLECKDASIGGAAPQLLLTLLDLAPNEPAPELLAPGASLSLKSQTLAAAIQAADHQANAAFFACQIPVALTKAAIIETFGDEQDAALTVTPASPVKVSMAR